MEGLKVREIGFLETRGNKDSRFDTDFWTEIPKRNSKLVYSTIGEVLTDAQYGISIAMNENGDGVPIYRMNEIHNMLCDFSVSKHATLTGEEQQVFLLNDRDVLFNRTNSYEWVGRTGLYKKLSNKDFVFASYLVRLVPDEKRVLPEYLTSFLNTKYGVAEIKRRARQSINQTNVNPEEVKAIEIPLISIAFQEKIKTNFDEAVSNFSLAETQYLFAETLLLETLGLTKFTPSTEAVNIKSFKDSFSATGRLDAEYYQPKYEQMMTRITASRHARLGELVDIKKSIEPGSDAYAEDEDGLPFLRVADYSKQGITSPQVRLNEKFVVENSDKIAELKPKRDTILFSKDGSVGEAYRLREDADFITSGAILHLTVKIKAQVLPDYLTLALNSIVVKQQAERDAGGSIILHWRKEEIENVLVPIVDMPTQQKIAAQIQESFKLKAESERLLEVAKRAVEIAIEQDEQAGLEYIERETGK